MLCSFPMRTTNPKTKKLIKHTKKSLNAKKKKTKQNLCLQSSSDRRIVWTYNAPTTAITTNTTSSYNNSQSFSSSISSSPQHTDTPASPTSVSSSIMSSNSNSNVCNNSVLIIHFPISLHAHAELTLFPSIGSHFYKENSKCIFA